MKIHNVIQGSQEWLNLRKDYRGASEAPVMMGASSKATRNELIHLKSTGLEKEYSEWVQKFLFDKGHEAEALARPIVEEIIGEELYPVVGVNEESGLLASLDGATMLGDIIFEHKLYNQQLAESVKNKDLSPEYYWQLEQQLHVSGAEKVIFVVSDGTKENMEYMFYEPVSGREKQLLAGWKQFDKDVQEYAPKISEPEVIGTKQESLPAISIQVTGEVQSSNLSDFKEAALSIFNNINKDLKTDQDFADAEQTVKWCKEIEDKLKLTKDYVLGQTASIDDVFKTIDDISDTARSTRLALEKLVKAKKENVKVDLIQQGRKALSDHMKSLYKQVGFEFSFMEADFAGAMKGKRTIESLMNAVDTELAKAKIEADQLAEKINKNLKIIAENAKDFEFLFNDKKQLVNFDSEALKELISARILKHKSDQELKEKMAAEQERQQAEQMKQKALDGAQAQEPSKPAVQNEQESLIPRKERPTDQEIIEVLCLKFRVHESAVVKWLLDMDLKTVSKQLEETI